MDSPPDALLSSWRKSAYSHGGGDDYTIPSISAPGLVPMHPGSMVGVGFDDDDDDDDEEAKGADLRPMKSAVAMSRKTPSNFSYNTNDIIEEDLERSMHSDSNQYFHAGIHGNDYYAMQSRGWTSLEEDEDSDGQDYEAPPLTASIQRRTATRMKSAKANPQKSHSKAKKSTSGVSKKKKGGAPSSNATSDGEVDSAPAKRRANVNSSSLFGKDGSILDQDVGAFDSTTGTDANLNSTTSSFDVQDFDDTSSHNSSSYNDNEQSTDSVPINTTSSPSPVTNKIRGNAYDRDYDEDEASVMTNNSSFINPNAMQVYLPESELREAFNHCALPDNHSEAYKDKLCLELYSVGAPSIADKLRIASSKTITWEQFKDVSRGKPIVDKASFSAASSPLARDTAQLSSESAPSTYSSTTSIPAAVTKRDDTSSLNNNSNINSIKVTIPNRISVASLLRPAQEDDGDMYRRPVEQSVPFKARESRDSVLVGSKEDSAFLHSNNYDRGSLLDSARVQFDEEGESANIRHVSWRDRKEDSETASSGATSTMGEQHQGKGWSTVQKAGSVPPKSAESIQLNMESEDEDEHEISNLSDDNLPAKRVIGKSVYETTTTTTTVPKSPGTMRIEIEKKERLIPNSNHSINSSKPPPMPQVINPKVSCPAPQTLYPTSFPVIRTSMDSIDTTMSTTSSPQGTLGPPLNGSLTPNPFLRDESELARFQTSPRNADQQQPSQHTVVVTDNPVNSKLKPPLPSSSFSRNSPVALRAGNNRGSVGVSGGGSTLQQSLDSSHHSNYSSDNDNANEIRDYTSLHSALVLPPLSALALRSGVIIEGWLEKKSSVTGMWLKRFFVLAESSVEFCVLKSFTKATEAAWGWVPTGISTFVPIFSIEALRTNTKKSAKGKEFSISVAIDSKGATQTHMQMPPSLIDVVENNNINLSINADGTRANTPNNNNNSTMPNRASIDSSSGFRKSSSEFDTRSDCSDFVSGKTKTIHLRAENPQLRLLWTMMLRRAIEAAYEEDSGSGVLQS